MLVAVVALAACGGKKTEPAHPQDKTPPAAEAPAASKQQEPKEPKEPPPAPPPAKLFKATADVAPVKGQKFKTATIKFTQKDSDPTAEVTSTGWFDGLPAGKYHFVIHTAAACGANASKAGAPFAAAAAAGMDFTVAKDGGNIDISGVAIQLEGDQTITGHVLVMHDDKAGKPGKVLGCGPIVTFDSAD
jgi:hypothetical protein